MVSSFVSSRSPFLSFWKLRMFTLPEQGVPAKPLEESQAYMSASYGCTVSRYCSVAAELATTRWR